MGTALWQGLVWFLRRLLLRLAQVFAVLAVAAVFLFVLLPEWRRAADDPVYAGRVFDGLVPVDRVIATRQWHPWGAEPWDCTFAIVALGAGAPPLPPDDRRDVGWQFRFGGDWRATPAEPLGDTTRDAVQTCGPNWDADTDTRLRLSLSQPGSWYARDGAGETVSVYAPLNGIAARIRFGD